MQPCHDGQGSARLILRQHQARGAATASARARRVTLGLSDARRDGEVSWSACHCRARTFRRPRLSACVAHNRLPRPAPPADATASMPTMHARGHTDGARPSGFGCSVPCRSVSVGSHAPRSTVLASPKGEKGLRLKPSELLAPPEAGARTLSPGGTSTRVSSPGGTRTSSPAGVRTLSPLPFDEVWTRERGARLKWAGGWRGGACVGLTAK
jgi:hypothetical protein